MEQNFNKCIHAFKAIQNMFRSFLLKLIFVYNATVSTDTFQSVAWDNVHYQLYTTVLVIIKLTKFAVALRLRCGSCKLIF